MYMQDNHVNIGVYADKLYAYSHYPAHFTALNLISKLDWWKNVLLSIEA